MNKLFAILICTLMSQCVWAIELNFPMDQVVQKEKRVNAEGNVGWLFMKFQAETSELISLSEKLGKTKMHYRLTDFHTHLETSIDLGEMALNMMIEELESPFHKIKDRDITFDLLPRRISLSADTPKHIRESYHYSDSSLLLPHYVLKGLDLKQGAEFAYYFEEYIDNSLNYREKVGNPHQGEQEVTFKVLQANEDLVILWYEIIDEDDAFRGTLNIDPQNALLYTMECTGDYETDDGKAYLTLVSETTLLP